MRLEVRIHISPEPHFFRQVQYVWRAFVAAGGHTANAIFKVFVGEDCEPYDLYEINPWSRGRIQWHWADREEFRLRGYGVPERFRAKVDGDVILFLDADTLLVRPIDDLLDALAAEPLVAGVMAHNPPFFELPSNWADVFAAVSMPLPADRYQHNGWNTLWNDPRYRFGPIYYNFGAVFVPGSMMERLGAQYISLMDRAIDAPIHPFFRGQLTLSLAIYQLNLPHTALGTRYNYPNLPSFDRAMASELADVRIIHYFTESTIGTRRGNWGSEEAFHAFLNRSDLTGSNEILRACAAAVHRMPIPAPV
jgi:hypothetical protein